MPGQTPGGWPDGVPPNAHPIGQPNRVAPPNSEALFGAAPAPVAAPPDAATPLDYYTATFGTALGLVRERSADAPTLIGGRPVGKRRIGVRIDIRDVAAGPRLVETSPDTPTPAPPGTTSFVTVVLSATGGG